MAEKFTGRIIDNEGASGFSGQGHNEYPTYQERGTLLKDVIKRASGKRLPVAEGWTSSTVILSKAKNL